MKIKPVPTFPVPKIPQTPIHHSFVPLNPGQVIAKVVVGIAWTVLQDTISKKLTEKLEEDEAKK